MSNLIPSPSLDNVPQLERTTVALGGPGAPMNIQAQALLNRTAYILNQISGFSGDIAALQSNVTSLNTNVSTINGQIITINGQITTLQGQVATNTSNIASNTSSITTLNSEVATNTSNIATNTSNIATNTSNIASNTSSISTINSGLGNPSGFLQPGSGSVFMTYLVKAQDWVTPESFGAVGDGVTDDTAALTNALATGNNLLLGDGRTYLTGPLTLASSQKIVGRGIWKTQLKAKGGLSSGYLVSLANVNVYAAGISGVTINCNASAQTNIVSGIGFDNTGGSGFPFGDPKHSISQCYVVNSNGTGYLIGNLCRGSTLRELYANQCAVYGLEISATDSYIEDVVAGACGTGIYSHGANNRHIGLKSFGSTTLGINVGGQRDTFVDCESQDNNGDGYNIVSGDRDITLIGCLADSNQGYGFNLNSATSAKLIGVRSITRSGGAHTQTAAFNFGAATLSYVQGKATGNTAVFAGTVTNNTILIDDGSGQDFKNYTNVAARQAQTTEVVIGQIGAVAGVRLGGDVTLSRVSSSIANITSNLQIAGFSVVRSGTGVISNAAGANGDLYIRQDGAAGSFLYAKLSGTWTAIA